MTPVFIADIASYQRGLSVAALRPDCVGVEIKCTEGCGYVNPDYAGWLPAAKSSGLLTVAYHYIDGTDPHLQAAHLAAHIIDPSLPVMIDAEKGAVGLPHVMDVADAMAGLRLRPRLLYLPRWWWNNIGGPDLAAPLASRGLALVNASYLHATGGTPAALYPGDTFAGWAGYGGVEPTLLQFTDAAQEGGQPVDMNAYRGTAAGLAALLGSRASDLGHPPFPGRVLIYRGPGILQMHGDDVRQWQTRMAVRGWRIAVDGWYGPQSDAVCRAFQQDSTAHEWPLAIDGQVGPNTWRAAFERPVS